MSTSTRFDKTHFWHGDLEVDTANSFCCCEPSKDLNGARLCWRDLRCKRDFETVLLVGGVTLQLGSWLSRLGLRCRCRVGGGLRGS